MSAIAVPSTEVMSRRQARRQGRKPGQPNRASQTVGDFVKNLALEGLLPLEVLLRNMRWQQDEIEASIRALNRARNQEDSDLEAILMGRVLRLMEHANETASRAADFCHPRMARVALQQEPTDRAERGLITVEFVDKAPLARSPDFGAMTTKDPASLAQTADLPSTETPALVPDPPAG